MRHITFAFIIIYSSFSLANQEKSGNELIQWLSDLSRHGIDISSDHWLASVESQSDNRTQEIVQLYSNYLDRGRLDKRYFQPGWSIPNRPELPGTPSALPPIEDIQPNIPSTNIWLML